MNSRELLNSILERSQHAQAIFHSMLSAAMTPSLRASVETQLKEFESIEAEAFSIAASRGWMLNDLQPTTRAMISAITRLRLLRQQDDSSLASAMIQSSMKGIIQGMTDQRRITVSDPRISNLLQKQLDCQSANIQKMQGFL